MDYEKLYKDLEPKFATLSGSLEKMSTDNTALKARVLELEGFEKKVTELQGQVTTLTETNKTMEKDLAIATTNAQTKENEIEAEKVTTKVLSTSSLPEGLHGKVKGHVDHTKFKTEAGTLDKEKFTTAFTAEVKDWEGKLKGKGGDIGGGDAKVEGETDSRTEKRGFWKKALNGDKGKK